MKLRILIILVLSYSPFSKLFSQVEIKDYQHMAMQFLQDKKYESSIEIFERILFFGDDNLAAQTYLPLARAYSSIGHFDKASVYYNNAFTNQKIDTVRYEILFESSLNYILDNDTALAYSELLNIPETNISNRISDKLNFYMGILDYKSGRYTTSKNHFLALKNLSNTDKKNINTFFNKTKKINRRYNPSKVEWMSLIPGLGQAWCGYYEESANAFFLSGALVALYLNVSYKYKVLDGLLTVYPWFNRYYKGGVVKSYKLAVKKRETEKNKLYNSFLKSMPPIY